MTVTDLAAVAITAAAGSAAGAILIRSSPADLAALRARLTRAARRLVAPSEGPALMPSHRRPGPVDQPPKVRARAPQERTGRPPEDRVAEPETPADRRRAVSGIAPVMDPPRPDRPAS